MSPLRPGRKLSAVLLFAMMTTLAIMTALGPAAAQDAPAAKSRTLELNAQEDNSKCPDGKGPCWDLQTLVANPGDAVRVIVNFTGAVQPHDFTIKVGEETIQVPRPSAVGGIYEATFTFPNNAKELNFYCSVHQASMFGSIKIQSELGVEEESIHELGVHFLAYWVGVIAFLLLFLVYGLTFFLFKYNETPATTDHWDRTGGEGLTDNPRMRGGRASLLALGLALVIIVGVVAAARYLG